MVGLGLAIARPDRRTLTPTSMGTHLRMEHSGFPPDREQAYQGAGHGWRRFLGNLEQVLARMD